MSRIRQPRRRGRTAATLAGITALALAVPAAADRYTVRPGDTLSGIASRHHTSTSALVKLNGIRHPDLIRIGQRLQLPASSSSTSAAGARAAAAVAGAGAAKTAAAAPPPSHVVQAGETITSVAAKYHVSPVALAAANGIVDGRLYRGARLRLDVSAAGAPVAPARPFRAQPTYVVRRGDSLHSVARRLGVAAAALARANNLSSNARLLAGQALAVPGRWTCPVAGHTSFVNDWGFSRAGGNWHQGVDLMAARGTPVVAPVSGRLERYPNRRGGNAFELYGDDGNRYYGAHLDRYGAQGRVRRGQVIGYVGNTGDASGGPTHLHFEIHPGGGDAVPPYPTLLLACR